MVLLKTSVKNMEKREICRNYYKKLRNTLLEAFVIEKSKSICNKIEKNNLFLKADIILAYYPFGNEVDCKSLIFRAIENGKKVGLPKIQANKQIEFYEVCNLYDDIEEGRFRIMEPKVNCKKIPLQNEIENGMTILALVPGVVFDKDGNRYGYGGGYYDRFFEKYPTVFRIALAYDLQIKKERLECFPTDIKMHRIFTESNVIEIHD